MHFSLQTILIGKHCISPVFKEAPGPLLLCTWFVSLYVVVQDHDQSVDPNLVKLADAFDIASAKLKEASEGDGASSPAEPAADPGKTAKRNCQEKTRSNLTCMPDCILLWERSSTSKPQTACPMKSMWHKPLGD